MKFPWSRQRWSTGSLHSQTKIKICSTISSNRREIGKSPFSASAIYSYEEKWKGIWSILANWFSGRSRYLNESDVSCSENHALNREKTVGIEWCSWTQILDQKWHGFILYTSTNTGYIKSSESPWVTAWWSGWFSTCENLVVTALGMSYSCLFGEKPKRMP